MNVLKLLRKPYYSVFFASLMLFISCNQYDDTITTDSQLNLDDFAKNHLLFVNDLSNILSDEVKSIILNQNHLFDDLESINILLAELPTQKKDEILNLIAQINLNARKLIESNPELIQLNESELNQLIESKIDLQLHKNYNVTFASRTGPCEDAHSERLDRCFRNFLISTGVSAIGLVLGGAVGALGAYVATLAYVECQHHSGELLDECNNLNQ